MKTKFYLLLTLICFLSGSQVFGQLNVSNFPPVTNGSPTWLVKNMLIGANSGIQVSNVQLSVGDSTLQVGYFDGSASNLNLPSGIVMTTGDISQAPGSGNIGDNASFSVSTFNNDVDLEAILAASGQSIQTNDAVVLEFDFVATRSSYAFNYVFASEEYEDYVCSSFNDVFGFFLSGPGISGPFSNSAVNVALIPGKPVPVSINTVNNGVSGTQGQDQNCAALDSAWVGNTIYYNSNVTDTTPTAIEFDGFTVPLKAVLNGLICGQTYHIKLAIADASDQILDSGVFLEKGSFTTNVFELGITSSNGQPINVDSAIVEGCDSVNLLVIRPDTTGFDTLPIFYSGAATLGVDYSSLPSQVIFTPGIDTLIFPISAILDGSTEGLEDLVITIPASTGTCLTDSSSVELNIFDGYNSFLSYTDESCGASNGSISVTTNATVTASLLWNDGSTDSIRTSLSAGNYTVTITDIAGCTQVLTASLNNITLDSISIAITNPILCNGDCSGAATVNVSGGVQPYSYLWDDLNNQVTASATGLCAGTYTVIVTDSIGCTIIDSISITEPTTLVTAITSTGVNCGATDGSACITVSGGVAPYNVTWNTGDTSLCLSNLASGSYFVTVTDANGCTSLDSTVVSGSSASLDSISVSLDTAILCNGLCNGAATAFVTGGVLPYTYAWNDPNNQTTASAVGLCAGSYTVVVTDSAGCTITGTISITEPLLLTADTASTAENCGNADGTACLTIAGGTFPYSITWSTGDTIACLTNLVAGVYTATVTDANGCSVVTSTQVQANAAACCPYEIVSNDTVCPGTTTCVWLSATQPVTNGIVGMNYCLSYDTAVVTPTGVANLGQVVYNALGQGNGEAVQINTAIPGQVFVTIYYNAGVPSGTFWQGAGDVICLEFLVDANAPNGLYNFSACEVEEAYELFEVGKCAIPDDLYVGSNSIVNGKVYYWNYDGVMNGPARPLIYDINNPSDHLITTINAVNGSGAWAHTDINGDFTWDANDGHQVILDRDIAGSFYDTTCTDVFAFINGADAYLAALINNFDMNNILDSNFNWVPNKYQMVAGDVNMNDKVRANDVTHIMSRSVRSICEFPQVWNYTFGNPANPLPDTTGGVVSKDWRFLPADDSLYAVPADWTVDANYPVYVSANANGGYWRDDVPSVPDTIDLFTPDTTQLCPSYDDRAFEAVLLGDLTGSWDPSNSVGTLVRASGSGIIHFDVFPIVGQVNNYNIEVSFEALSDRSSIDFRLDYNESNLTVQNVTPTIEASSASLITDWNDYANDKLYVSSYTMSGINTTDAVYNIEVITNGPISTQDLGTIFPMLNGEVVNADVTIHGTTGVKDTYTQAGYFNVFPNPTSGIVNIEYALATEGNVQLNVTNVLGQSVFAANLGNMNTLNMKTLDLSRFESGVYNIKLSSEKGEIVKKIILE